MRIIFAGGGTGGHLYPAVAIAEQVLKLEPSAVISFVGTEKGIEASEVPKLGFALHLIPAVGLKRGFSPQTLFENLKFPFRLYESLNECKRLLFQEEPDVVVGTGGFVSAPVVWQAQSWEIPTLIQEQNAKPGLATRILAHRADEVHLSFLESLDYFDRDDVFVTGNPTRAFETRPKAEACEFFGIDASRKTLLVFGGSLGARSLNRAVESWLDDALRKFNVIWQTGKLDFESLAARVGKKKNLWLGAFIDRMDYAYSAADLALCRAGASTLAELCNLGVAAVLAPYPFAAANHQVQNAKAMAESGAAEMILDQDIGSQRAKEKIFDLIENDEKLAAMRAKAKKRAKPNAALNIAKRVIALAKADAQEEEREPKSATPSRNKNAQPEAAWKVEFDEDTIWRTSPSGERDELKWSDVRRVIVETNDSGPFGSDVWWRIESETQSLRYPMGASGEKELLARLQKLPNFNNDALLSAMMSTDNQTFLLWKKQEK